VPSLHDVKNVKNDTREQTQKIIEHRKSENSHWQL